MPKYEHVVCNLCGNDHFTFISDQVKHADESKVVICNDCGLVQLNPRMTAEGYREYYQTGYDNHYRSGHTGNDFRSIKAILYRLRNLDLTPTAPKKILEIGSGKGDSLIYLKKNVFKTSDYFAVEPSIESRENLEKHSISFIADIIENLDVNQYREKFDFVILRHVAEHFLNPTESFQKISQVLAPGGLLYVAVPNALKPKHPIPYDHFRGVHTYYYNKYTLPLLLAKTNLGVVKMIEGDCFQPHELVALVKKQSHVHKTEFDPQNVSIQTNLYLSEMRNAAKPGFKLRYFLKSRYAKYKGNLLLSFS